MLSYRHAFHAGNFADLLKHITLTQCITYLLKKPSPISYIDTHAGAGIYELSGEMAQKTGEFKEGIQQIKQDVLSQIAPNYNAVIEDFIKREQYPGSPLIAKNLLRKNDHLHLFELHPRDHQILTQYFKGDAKTYIYNTNSHKHLINLLPTKGRRALVLIDPSYEIKSEYTQVATTLIDAYRRMPNAVFLLWFPIVERLTSNKLIKRLENARIKDIQTYELGTHPDHEGYGMTSSAMLVINGPWALAREMKEILPCIAKNLGKQSHWSIQHVTQE